MPHLTLEATANLRHALESAAVLDAAHRALLGSGVFDGPDVKSRWLWLESFRIGQAPDAGGFVHASLQLLSGRSASVRSQLSLAVVQALAGAMPAGLGLSVQISCEVREMNRDCYAKAIPTD